MYCRIKIAVRLNLPHVERAAAREISAGCARSEIRVAFLGAQISEGIVSSVNRS